MRKRKDTDFFQKATNIKKGLEPIGQVLELFGGAEQDRTVDLLTASQALSQLSYSPT